MSHTQLQHRGNRHNNTPRDLQICWVNIGKKRLSHIAILETAFEEGIDIICVQEPSTFPPTRTQNHPSYHRYDPVDLWDSEE